LLFSTSDGMRVRVMKMLGDRFKVKDLGKAEWVLGMRVQQGDVVTIDQSQYIGDVLKRYQNEIQNATNPRRSQSPATPLPSDVDLRKTQDDETVIDKPYREVVGSLAYLMIGTRPDIAYAVSWLSRHLCKPT